MIAVIIINYRGIADTLECLEHLLKIDEPAFHVFLVDNGSGNDDAAQLQNYASHYPCITFIAFPENYGFTGAHNRLFAQIIPDKRYELFLLLNNDTTVEPDFLTQMLAQIDRSRKIEMVAAQVMKYDNHEQVDNLGITFYKCGLASNRKQADDPLLGPSGNCALYTRELLQNVHQVTGEYFDEYFFCYAEDTDLAWRAVLLGYQAAYAENARIYHKGSVASGGANSDFVLYYGIRNSLFVLIKDISCRIGLYNLLWIIILHVAILLRYSVKGKSGIVFRLYRDVILNIAPMWRKRRVIQQQRQIPHNEIADRISRLFYERDYTLNALRDLF